MARRPPLITGCSLLVLAVGGVLLARYTSHKLEAGKMVRGEVPGATFLDAKVLGVRDISTYQCELSVQVVNETEMIREWADRGECPRFRAGGPAQMAKLPGDDELQLVHGTWASTGNGKFDEALLGGEHLCTAVLALAGVLFVGLGLRARKPPPRVPPARVVA
jgi:hypothetical protein